MDIHCANDYFLNKLLITVLNKQTDKRTNIKPNTVFFQVQLGSSYFRTEERRKRRATFSEQIIVSNILFVLLCIYLSFFLSFFSSSLICLRYIFIHHYCICKCINKRFIVESSVTAFYIKKILMTKLNCVILKKKEIWLRQVTSR